MKFAVTARRVAILATLAVGCLFVLTSTFARLDLERAKVVQQPLAASNGSVVVGVEIPDALAAVATAVILRIENQGASAEQFDVRIGETLCATTVISARTVRRVDCSVPAGTVGNDDGSTNNAVVSSASASWRLLYLELATHHGSSGGHGMLILPNAREDIPQPPWPAVILLAVLPGLLVGLLDQPRMAKWLAVAWLVPSCMIVLAAGLILLAPMVSQFRIVISVELYLKVLLLLSAPRVTAAVMRGYTEGWILHPLVQAVAVVLLVAGVFGSVEHRLLREIYDYNFSGFLGIARERFEAHPTMRQDVYLRNRLVLADNTGYDGQFFFFAAHDPALLEFKTPGTYQEFIDAPTYRYGRIGYSLLARLIALGDATRLPVVMTALVFVCLLAAAGGLAFLATGSGRSPWWGATTALIPGFWQSIQVALPEPISAAFLVWAYACRQRGSTLLSGGLAAVSLLIPVPT